MTCGNGFDKARQFRWLLCCQIIVVHHADSLVVLVCKANISFACWPLRLLWMRKKTIYGHRLRPNCVLWRHLAIIWIQCRVSYIFGDVNHRLLLLVVAGLWLWLHPDPVSLQTFSSVLQPFHSLEKQTSAGCCSAGTITRELFAIYPHRPMGVIIMEVIVVRMPTFALIK